MYNIHTITIYIVVNNHSTTLFFFTILLCVNLLRASFLASPANLFGRHRQAAKDSRISQKWRGHCRRPPNCMSQLTIKGEKYRGGGFAFPPSQRLLPQIIPRSNLSYPPRDDPFMTHKLPPFLGGSLYGKDSRCGTWGNLYILTTSKRRDASPCTAKRCWTGEFYAKSQNRSFLLAFRGLYTTFLNINWWNLQSMGSKWPDSLIITSNQCVLFVQSTVWRPRFYIID